MLYVSCNASLCDFSTAQNFVELESIIESSCLSGRRVVIVTLGVLPGFILATGVECGDTIDYNLAPGSQAHIMQLKKDLMRYIV